MLLAGAVSLACALRKQDQRAKCAQRPHPGQVARAISARACLGTMNANQVIVGRRGGERIVRERMWIDTCQRSDDPAADQDLAQQRYAGFAVGYLLGHPSPPAIRQPDVDRWIGANVTIPIRDAAEAGRAVDFAIDDRTVKRRPAWAAALAPDRHQHHDPPAN